MIKFSTLRCGSLVLLSVATAGCVTTYSYPELRPARGCGTAGRSCPPPVVETPERLAPRDEEASPAAPADEAAPEPEEESDPAIVPTSAEEPAKESAASDDYLPNALESGSANDEVVIDSTAPITLAELEELAMEYNPAILQAEAVAHKAEGYRYQVGLRPNPTVGYNGMQLGDQGTDQHTGFIEQEFVTADKLAKNRAVLSQEVQTRLWDAETQRFRVRTDLQQRFYVALAAQRRVELAGDFESVAEEAVRIAALRYEAQEGAKPDLLQSEIQLNQIRLMRQQAEIVYRNAWKQLAAIAGLPDMQPRPLEGSLSLDDFNRDWDAIEQGILSASPELEAARSQLARARLNHERQCVQAVPNLTLQVGAGKDYATNDDFFVNTQLGLPLPIYNRNQGNISAAHAELVRASQNVDRIESSIRARLAQARSDYEEARVAVERYRVDILPRANETLTLAEKAYGAGEFSFFDVYINRRTYFDTNLEYVMRQLDLRTANALIEGLLLTGGLDDVRDVEYANELRDQTFGQQ